MGKRIRTQMFVYLETDRYFLERGGMGQFQNISHPSKTAEKIPRKGSHGGKSSKSFILSRLKNSCANYNPQKTHTQPTKLPTSIRQKINGPSLIAAKYTILNLFRAQFTCQPGCSSPALYKSCFLNYLTFK